MVQDDKIKEQVIEEPVIIAQLTEKPKANKTEELKAINQMEWVQKMNNIKNSVEEISFKMYIYN